MARPKGWKKPVKKSSEPAAPKKTSKDPARQRELDRRATPVGDDILATPDCEEGSLIPGNVTVE